MKIGNTFSVKIWQRTSRGQSQQREKNDFRELILKFSMVSFFHTGTKLVLWLVLVQSDFLDHSTRFFQFLYRS